MSSSSPSQPFHEFIEGKKEAYLEDECPETNQDWPPDVRAVLNELQNRLFDLDLRVTEVYRKCGCYNHNISLRFKGFLGRTPKAYVLHHRLKLAKQLLRETDFSVGQIALSVGYGSPSAFTNAFKKHEETTPTDFRKRQEKDKEN